MTPLWSEKEVKQITSPSLSFFWRALEGKPPTCLLWEKFSYSHLQPTSVLKDPSFAYSQVRQGCGYRSTPSQYTQSAEEPRSPQKSKLLRQGASMISSPVPASADRRLNLLHPLLPHAGVESSIDHRRNVKGNGKAVRALEGISAWLAEYRQRRKAPTGSYPCIGVARDEHVGIHSTGTLALPLLLWSRSPQS